MATKLIELKDGSLIEIELPADEAEQISGGADKVDSTIDRIKPVLMKTCKPVLAVWDELNKETHIEQVEIELGLGFEAEGNIFVTKAKTKANLTVKLILKQKPEKCMEEIANEHSGKLNCTNHQ